MKAIKAQWQRLAKELEKKDRKLAPYIRKVGEPKIIFKTDPFRALVESIVWQQLAPKAAYAIVARIAELSPPFPDALKVLAWKETKLRKAGVSSAKVKYIRALANALQDKKWASGWAKLSDAELVSRLCEVKGIGEWTAHMFLIFSFGRPDVLPVGDYGIRQGLQILFELDKLPSSKEIQDLVPHWKGASSIGSWYIWQAMDQKLLVFPHNRRKAI